MLENLVMAKQFRALVEAVEVLDKMANRDEIEVFLGEGGTVFGDNVVTFHFACGILSTACPGDWIVKDWRGRFFAVHSDVFLASFSAV
jgi:hypothetical protein